MKHSKVPKEVTGGREEARRLRPGVIHCGERVGSSEAGRQEAGKGPFPGAERRHRPLVQSSVVGTQEEDQSPTLRGQGLEESSTTSMEITRNFEGCLGVAVSQECSLVLIHGFLREDSPEGVTRSQGY